MKSNFKKFLTISVIGLTFIASQAIAIGGKYSNNLLKVGLNKGTDGNVEVTLYTSNVYKTKPMPVKRAENTYVIILPETYHSITSNPSNKNLENDIDSVDVKLLPYIGASSDNGYTKLTIKTKSPENIVIRNELVNTNSSQDDDVKNILAKGKALIKPITPKSLSVPLKIAQKPQPQKILPKVALAQKQPEIKIEKKPVEQKIEPKPVKKETVKTVLPTIEVKKEELIPPTTIKQETPAPQVIPVNAQPVKENFVKTHKKFLYIVGISAVVVPLLLFLVMLKLISKVNKKRFKEELSLQEEGDERFSLEELKAQVPSNAYAPVFEKEESSENDFAELEDLFDSVEESTVVQDIEEEFEREETILISDELPQEPKVLAEAEITHGHGFYLVDFERQISLLYVKGAEVTVLKRFDSIEKSRIIMKKYTEKDGIETYMVRVDRWQSLVNIKGAVAELALNF